MSGTTDLTSELINQMLHAGNSFGGYQEDYPLPLFWKYPSVIGEKRPVLITISKYYGIGQHFHCYISERDNEFWDDKEKVWRRCWDRNDILEYRGFCDSFSHKKRSKIYKQIAKIIKEQGWTKESHEIEINDCEKDGTQKWFYRDGD